MQLETVASLAVAKSGNVATTNGIQVDDIISAVERAGAARRATPDAAGRHRRILRVDDTPQDNVWERQAFEAQGYSFSLALDTDEALRILDDRKFAAIVSYMGREEGSREGYVLLAEVRRRGIDTPFFIHSSSVPAERRAEILEYGGNGTTNDANELLIWS